MKQFKFCISIGEDLYNKAKQIAKSRQMSLGCLIRQLLIDYIERG